jgi:hypothetical protein
MNDDEMGIYELPPSIAAKFFGGAISGDEPAGAGFNPRINLIN